MRPVSQICRRLRWAAVLAVALTVTAGARANGTGTLRYLAVGVSNYAHINSLNCAHRDAFDLTKIWQSQKGKRYADVVGQTMIDGEATLANVLTALDRLAEGTKAGDMVVVSLSGHGGFGRFRDPDWYFMVYDTANGDTAKTALPASVLRAKLTTMSERGATVILILDACFSGGYGGSDGNIVVLASSMPHQTSLEDKNLMNGLHTRALIEALQGAADSDRDGSVTLAEIDAYVASRVPQLVVNVHGAGNSEQHPTSAKPTSVRSAMALVHVVAPQNPPRPAKP